MSTQGNSEVREWLARTFQDELPLTHAVTSLDNNPLIELRKSRINNKYTVSSWLSILCGVVAHCGLFSIF